MRDESQPEIQAWNQQTYERLKIALSLNLRRQVFIAVCDNLSLRNHWAHRLERELVYIEAESPFVTNSLVAIQTPPKRSALISLELNTDEPNLVAQIAHWFAEHLIAETAPSQSKYGFQILGIERLTRYPLATQQQFLNSLKVIGRNLPSLEFSLLLWVPRPWLYSIKQSTPEFWRCHTGLFEFLGEPSLEPEALPISHQHSAMQVVDLLADQVQETQDQQKMLPETVVVATSASVSELSFEEYLQLAYQYRDRITQKGFLEQSASSSGQAGGETQAETLSLAIAAYEQVLARLGDDLSLLPDLLNDLGNFYWLQSRLQTATAIPNLEQAVVCYETALEHLQAGGNAPNALITLNRLYNNLGTACSDLARYREPAANLQKAIASYTATLEHTAPEPLTLDQIKAYALSHNNLGTAYWNLAQHQEPTQQLKNAIAAYQQAQHYWELSLQQEDAEATRLNYGMIHNNLGTAYWNLAQYEQPEHYLLMAVWSYQIALQYRTLSAAPNAHAATQNNLGTTYWHLAHCPTCYPTPQTPATEASSTVSRTATTQDHYLHCCIQAYEAALATIAQLTHPMLSFDRFATHHNLGLAYRQVITHGSQQPGMIHPLQALEAALEHHSQAWQGWQNQPEQAQTAVNAIIEVIRSLYNEGGLSKQNAALAKVPPRVLPEILRRL